MHRPGYVHSAKRTSNPDWIWWKDHIEELLNPINTSSAEEAESENFQEDLTISLAEVAEVVKKIHSGKAAGVDRIYLEMLKVLDIVGLSWQTCLFSVAWRLGTVPLEWQTGVVAPIFKKGDRMVCSNYQGIILLSLPGIIYSKVLEWRLWLIVEPLIKKELRRFHPGCRAMDQLITLACLLRASWEFAHPVYICFLDLEITYEPGPLGILFWGVL